MTGSRRLVRAALVISFRIEPGAARDRSRLDFALRSAARIVARTQSRLPGSADRARLAAVELAFVAPRSYGGSRMIPNAHDLIFKDVFSNQLLREFRALNKEFWGRHLWVRGYFAASSGNVTDDVIKKYIELQGAEPQDDDKFRISRSLDREARRLATRAGGRRPWGSWSSACGARDRAASAVRSTG